MNKKVRASIEASVSSIHTQCRIIDFPVNVYEVFSVLGIPLIEYSNLPLKDITKAVVISKDGFCGKINNQYVVFYNDSVVEVRARFTLMHELGHIVLGHTKQGKEEEVEANYFASYMLVPDKALELFLAYKTKEEISEEFKVSGKCAEIAYHRYIRNKQEKPRQL